MVPGPRHPSQAVVIPAETFDTTPVEWPAWLDDRAALQRAVQSLDLARHLAADDLTRLAELGRVRRCHAGERIVVEGQRSNSLYWVLLGNVSVIKSIGAATGTSPAGADAEPGLAVETNFFRIKELRIGAVFGEMSFIDGNPASATVVADCASAIFIIDHSTLDADPDGIRLGHVLTAAVATAVIQRMRDLNEEHAASLQAELDQGKLRVDLARFFTVTMVLFGISSAVTRLIHTGLPPSTQMLLSWSFLLLTFAPIAWFAWQQRLPLSTFGLTTRNANKSMRESLVAALVGSAVIVAYAASTRAPGESLFAWGSLASYSHLETVLFFALYPAHCFLQELIGRGVIQGSLARLMPDARPATPVALTSALFGIYHLYVSLQFALVTVVASLLFGWLYRRHGTLVGVTTLHLLLGCASVAVGLN
ncbi:MAG: CPBP family intramembrane metalloprotease [Deltaproteobacteria bacterium]|nr:CPBP family intramembrane metalloprotease [Deltaproteobacteria bacterium]